MLGRGRDIKRESRDGTFFERGDDVRAGDRGGQAWRLGRHAATHSDIQNCIHVARGTIVS